MRTLRTVLVSVLLVLSAGVPAVAASDESISLVFSGAAVPNGRPLPNDKAFTDWCTATTGMCFPTVQQPVYDAATGLKRGDVFVWGAFPFNSTSTYPAAFCFSEFMVFVLDRGEITVNTGPNGTCAGFMDPAIKPPHAAYPTATVVIAGGGDGAISTGTGRYKNWTGTFTERMFMGFGPPTAGVGGIVYYDQWLFRISRN